jgi:hypothetical protein
MSERQRFSVDLARTTPWLLRPAVGCLGAPLALFALMMLISSWGTEYGKWIWVPLLMLATWYATTIFRRHEGRGQVVVGADGVLIERPGRTRFVSFADVTDVRFERGRGQLRCHLQVGDKWLRLAADTRALYDTVQERWRMFSDASDGAEQLRRAEERLAHVSDFRNLGSADYRAAGIDPNDLEALVEDCSAPVALRAAAATALEDRGIERLRIQADDLVAPGHRDALLRIADAEPDARQPLIEALAEEEEAVLLGEA